MPRKNKFTLSNQTTPDSKHKILQLTGYWPRSRGDNTFGSVRPMRPPVRLSVHLQSITLLIYEGKSSSCDQKHGWLMNTSEKVDSVVFQSSMQCTVLSCSTAYSRLANLKKEAYSGNLITHNNPWNFSSDILSIDTQPSRKSCCGVVFPKAQTPK